MFRSSRVDFKSGKHYTVYMSKRTIVMIFKPNLKDQEIDSLIERFVSSLRSNEMFGFALQDWGLRKLSLPLRYGYQYSAGIRYTIGRYISVVLDCSKSICDMSIDAIRSSSDCLHAYQREGSGEISEDWSTGDPCDVLVQYEADQISNTSELSDALDEFVYSLGYRKFRYQIVASSEAEAEADLEKMHQARSIGFDY